MSDRAVIYARQSQDRAGTGAAVDRQVEDCRKLATTRGWDVVEVITDNDMSASTGKERPGYQRVLGLIERGAVERVIVWHVDRLTRRLIDLERVVDLCERTGVRLATVTGDLDLSTDTGRLLARILASVARAEVERKGARQRRANEQRAGQGRMPWTRRPFGYDREAGRVVVVESEAAGLREAAQLVLAGSSLAKAGAHLDSLGLPTTRGLPWNPTTLRRTLLNPRHAGRVVYKGTDAGPGAWPAILDPATQERLGEVLRDPARRKHQGTVVKYLLSGLAVCGRCGATMFASPMGAKGARYMTYRCRTGHLARRLDLVDEVVEGVIVARLSRPDARTLLAPDLDVDKLRAQAVELRRRRDGLAGLLADGLLSPSAVRAQAGKLTQALETLDGQITAALGDSPAVEVASAEDPADAWQRLPLTSRRQVVELLVEVMILPAGKGVPFDPQHVRVGWRQA